MTIAQDLNAHLCEAASTPFEYRSHDCCTFVSDWVMRHGYDDPMARWRGRYASEGAARELMDRYGLLDMWTLGMIEVGVPEADEARIGDVGLVECVSDDGVNLVGAIYGGKRWHALGEKGLFQASMKPVKVWRCG